MVLPKRLRYYTTLRKAGNSLFVLIPALIRDFMGLEPTSQITLSYDTKLKKITIREVRK